MNGCPPHPGFTVMQRTRSAASPSSDDGLGGRAGVDRDPGQAAELADRGQGAVGVRRRLGMERDAVGAGLGELLDLALGALDHQVHVDRAAGVVDPVGDRGQRPAGPIVIGGTKWPSITSTWIIRAPAAITSSTCAPSREKSADRIDGRDPALARAPPSCRPWARSCAPHIGLSIEWRQCWQSMSSVVLMRAIVWCSPQFGHCETSS